MQFCNRNAWREKLIPLLRSVNCCIKMVQLVPGFSAHLHMWPGCISHVWQHADWFTRGIFQSLLWLLWPIRREAWLRHSAPVSGTLTNEASPQRETPARDCHGMTSLCASLSQIPCRHFIWSSLSLAVTSSQRNKPSYRWTVRCLLSKSQTPTLE